MATYLRGLHFRSEVLHRLVLYKTFSLAKLDRGLLLTSSGSDIQDRFFIVLAGMV